MIRAELANAVASVAHGERRAMLLGGSRNEPRGAH